MSNIIDSIQLSGVTYTIQGSGGGGVPESAFTAYTAATDARIAEDEEVTAAGLNAINDRLSEDEEVTAAAFNELNEAISGISGNNVVELTQAEYDALVDKDPTAFYIITDATAGDLTQYWTSAQTQSAITSAVSTKQDTLVSGTNIKTINNESILGSGNIDIQGGGKAVSGGTNISITTGETADTINCTLPYYKLNDYDNYSIFGNDNSTFINKATNTYQTIFIGYNNEVKGDSSNKKYFGNSVIGNNNIINGHITDYSKGYNVVIGDYNRLSGTNLSDSYVIGKSNSGYTSTTLLTGWYNQAYNYYETTFGRYNNSVSASTTFGDSGNTLFSVGNGYSTARHNAFEIRQNGDIYLTKDGQDVKLQDQLGGGGSSYTAGDGINITNNVISVTGKADTSAVTAIQDSLSGYVTTDTEQIISGRKIFTYSSSSGKAIEFKQTSDSAKVGFRIINSADTNNEVASFEFRPNTFTIDNVQHPLMYFGHYRNKNVANAGVPQTVIGFRQYDQLNAAAYHYLLPLPEKAKTPFSLTTSFKDYYAPIGFKNGSTMITADNTGVVDLSSELDGLKLKKLTQAEYDSLATKDSNTLYIIT